MANAQIQCRIIRVSVGYSTRLCLVYGRTPTTMYISLRLELILDK
jgi:hypothetical protein